MERGYLRGEICDSAPVKESTSRGEGDDFEAVALCERGGLVLGFEEGGLVVFDDYGLFGEAEFREEGEDVGRVGFGAFAVELNFHGGLPFQNGFVPIFPNGLEAGGGDGLREVGGGALVVDGELLGGAGARRFFFFGHLDTAAFLGAVQVVTACSSVAAGVGGAAGGHVGRSQSHHIVAEGGRLAGGDHDAGGGEAKSGRGDELHQLAVAEVAIGVGSILIVAGVGSHAGEGDRELGFPAMLVQIFQMRRKGESLGTPVGEAKKSADANAAEASAIGALRAFEPPVEILFRSSGVKGFVGVAVVGLLINDEAFGAGFDKFGILVVFHGADFDPDGRKEGANLRTMSWR